MQHITGKLAQSALLLAIAALMAACASSPPEPEVDFNRNFDFTKIRTIAFLPHQVHTSGDSPRALLSDMTVERIDDALHYAIEAKGFNMIYDPSKADALITWHLVAQEKTDVRTYNTGPAMGGYYGRYGAYNRRAYYSCWNCGGTEVSVRQYTQGTFIVDIIDPKQNKSVWRSVTQSRLRGEAGQEQIPYNEAAVRVLGGFPPL
jgi:hypothetical protein